MKTLTTDLLEEILCTVQEVKAPFPTYDCEMVARQAGIDPQSLVSDLDTYFYDIALITQENAADLYQRLQIVDGLQKDLVLFLSEVLARHEAEKTRKLTGV